jgi:hypothetical protein
LQDLTVVSLPRICNTKGAPRGDHSICCYLTKRLQTNDSTITGTRTLIPTLLALSPSQLNIDLRAVKADSWGSRVRDLGGLTHLCFRRLPDSLLGSVIGYIF